jgi:hypothetical protein
VGKGVWYPDRQCCAEHSPGWSGTLSIFSGLASVGCSSYFFSVAFSAAGGVLGHLLDTASYFLSLSAVIYQLYMLWSHSFLNTCHLHNACRVT